MIMNNNKVLRAFISQPMRDKTNEEILKEREVAKLDLERRFGKEVEIIDSFFKDAPHDAKPLWFLSKSIELLSTADVVYMCKGWENYRGCKIEEICAKEYGLTVFYAG